MTGADGVAMLICNMLPDGIVSVVVETPAPFTADAGRISTWADTNAGISPNKSAAVRRTHRVRMITPLTESSTSS
jgi:hypothetical protein